VTSRPDCSGLPIFVWTMYENGTLLVRLRLSVQYVSIKSKLKLTYDLGHDRGTSNSVDQRNSLRITAGTMAVASGVADVVLTPADIPGADLSEPLESHTMPALRWWLLCRGISLTQPIPF